MVIVQVVSWLSFSILHMCLHVSHASSDSLQRYSHQCRSGYKALFPPLALTA